MTEAETLPEGVTQAAHELALAHFSDDERLTHDEAAEQLGHGYSELYYTLLAAGEEAYKAEMATRGGREYGAVHRAKEAMSAAANPNAPEWKNRLWGGATTTCVVATPQVGKPPTSRGDVVHHGYGAQSGDNIRRY